MGACATVNHGHGFLCWSTLFERERFPGITLQWLLRLTYFKRLNCYNDLTKTACPVRHRQHRTRSSDRVKVWRRQFARERKKLACKEDSIIGFDHPSYPIPPVSRRALTSRIRFLPYCIFPGETGFSSKKRIISPTELRDGGTSGAKPASFPRFYGEIRFARLFSPRGFLSPSGDILSRVALVGNRRFPSWNRPQFGQGSNQVGRGQYGNRTPFLIDDGDVVVVVFQHLLSRDDQWRDKMSPEGERKPPALFGIVNIARGLPIGPKYGDASSRGKGKNWRARKIRSSVSIIQATRFHPFHGVH